MFEFWYLCIIVCFYSFIVIMNNVVLSYNIIGVVLLSKGLLWYYYFKKDRINK